MTRADHASGSDRIFEALTTLDPQGRARIVVNVQGDLPTLAPHDLRAVLQPLDDPAVDIATLARGDQRKRRHDNPQCREGGRLGRSRRAVCVRSISPAPPRPPATDRSITTSGFMLIGARRWSASSRLPPSPLEQREKLEQLRALEAGMRIDVAIVDSVPLGVDTPRTWRKRAPTSTSLSEDDDRCLIKQKRVTKRPMAKRKKIAFQGEPGANSRSRLPQGLSRSRDDALPDLRGRVRRRAFAAGRPRHDPDRKFGRRARRGHPSPDAAFRPAHRRRIFSSRAASVDGAEGRDAEDASRPWKATSWRSANAARHCASCS